MKGKAKRLNRARIEVAAAAGFVILGIILTIVMGSGYISYFTSSDKVSGWAEFDPRYSEGYTYEVGEKGYRAVWDLETDGFNYSFTTIEDHVPNSAERRAVRGYIDKDGELHVVSNDGIMGMLAGAFSGPILILAGAFDLPLAIRRLGRERAAEEKKQAAIDERLATQAEYEAWVDQVIAQREAEEKAAEEARKMTREKAMKIIADEGLERYNFFEDRPYKADEVVIERRGRKWQVFFTSERQAKMDETMDEYDTESEALEDFIGRLRADKEFRAMGQL